MAGLFVTGEFSIRNFTKIAKKARVNHEIKVPTVRLVSEDHEQLGIMGTDKARGLAEEQGLDLVEVSPKATPPVCKIMDYGKFQYQQKKVDQKQKKAQKKREMKGIRLTLRTDVGDMEVKLKRAKQFLDAGNSLKIQLMFKGREIVHKDLGLAKMIQFRDGLLDIAKVDQEPKSQGHTMNMILSPLK